MHIITRYLSDVYSDTDHSGPTEFIAVTNDLEKANTFLKDIEERSAKALKEVSAYNKAMKQVNLEFYKLRYSDSFTAILGSDVPMDKKLELINQYHNNQKGYKDMVVQYNKDLLEELKKKHGVVTPTDMEIYKYNYNIDEAPEL